jgi:hypothetical protein
VLFESNILLTGLGQPTNPSVGFLVGFNSVNQAFLNNFSNLAATEPAITFTTKTGDVSGNRMTILADGKVGIGTSTPTETLDINGIVRHRASIVSLAGAGTVTPTTNYVEAVCTSGAGPCDVTLGEVGASEGQLLIFLNTGATGSFTFIDRAGIQQIAGTATLTLANSDNVTFIYVGDQWVEISRTDT